MYVFGGCDESGSLNNDLYVLEYGMYEMIPMRLLLYHFSIYYLLSIMLSFYLYI